jgi:hypothetical protein
VHASIGGRLRRCDDGQPARSPRPDDPTIRWAPGKRGRPEGSAGGSAGATPRRLASEEPGDISFGDVLSALNPLQYSPVVGSIYRAVTGDTIPETLKTVGSLAVSGILGGPIGLAISAATTLFEKVSGIETDRIVHQALAAVGLAAEKPEAALAAGEPPLGPAATSAAVPWTRAQRTAYRTVLGSPVPGPANLEAIPGPAANERARRQAAAAAYARTWLARAEAAPHRSASRLSA